MTSLGSGILSTDRADGPDLPKVDGDGMILDNFPVIQEGCVVINRVSEACESLVVIDHTFTEAADGKQAKAPHDDKGVHYTNDMGLPSVQDKSPIDERNKCQADAKDEQTGARKQLKRKRVASNGKNNYDKELLTTECRQELNELFEYYKEVSGLHLHLDNVKCHSNDSMIAYLLEERSLPFSKLVEEIYEKLKGREGITLASIRSTVLFVGQRVMYGIPSANADVLEDESESCLWCWETRDVKLLSTTLRGILSIRRLARKKIHERISVLSATLSVLTSSEQKDGYEIDLMKAPTKLRKVLNKQGISLLVEKLTQKNCAEMAEKEARLREKETMKEVEKSKQSAEKEKKKIDRELQKEKLRNEKEFKRMQEEAEREEKRREKEQIELQKQIKKQQEEAAREQRRREKEEAELKKQRTMQKQASMMELFLRSKKISNTSDNSDRISPIKNPSTEIASINKGMNNAVTSSMDSAFSQQHNMDLEDLQRFHVCGWRKLARTGRASRWGFRCNPKTELFKEIKLQKPSSLGQSLEECAITKMEISSCELKNSSQSSSDKLDAELETFTNNMSCQNDLIDASSLPCLLKKKLLQFDKSHRPAYYGTWRRKSGIVGPRRPFRKDPEFDYDVDSDEEWEEEDPGESISDCDKDEEESLDAENLKDEDDTESEDGFVVPDGYLSESEGVQIETTSDPMEAETNASTHSKLETDNEEFKTLLQQMKILYHLTEKALRKSQPLVISNLNHEKAELLRAEDLTGTDKVEQICLQTLCMQAFLGGSIIDVYTNPSSLCEDQPVTQSSKEITTQAGTAEVISESDLPECVRLIQSCPHGINKMVEVFQQKFPSISKTQVRNKIREISDYVDNRWQVKKDVLHRLGLPSQPSPETGKKQKGIAMYFSKRCLPPQGKSINVSQSSPQSCSNSKTQNVVMDSQCPGSGLQFDDL
ncbi:chromatin assembly factor 1 subunit FAS1-like [Canna indica]|uniref:Chromatin assembly factor 1 subunit FAS1-like n=1 Tax=Canna indica TaxID=4628 RepID=A0AAQ3K9M0_9LILI|nr:chromatin assembly factor 1 subunit FAS1-like [Canna indica]